MTWAASIAGGTAAVMSSAPRLLRAAANIAMARPSVAAVLNLMKKTRVQSAAAPASQSMGRGLVSDAPSSSRPI